MMVPLKAVVVPSVEVRSFDEMESDGSGGEAWCQRLREVARDGDGQSARESSTAPARFSESSWVIHLRSAQHSSCRGARTYESCAFVQSSLASPINLVGSRFSEITK